ncbi:MAG: preprotein translocase subunit SecE [Candidatus Pacebacteria bacterium]|nr:preprotein translocase subunit SecE [Candidatus Paceibacterota bacterium]
MKSSNKIGNFFGDVGSEIKKITWPTRTEAIQYTLTVVVIVVITAALLGLFDYFFNIFYSNL